MAQYELGRCCATGQGKHVMPPPTPTPAAAHVQPQRPYQTAPSAACDPYRMLGLAGTPLDGLLAEQWWLQAVSDGNALVQYELGTFYAGGQVRLCHPVFAKADR